MYSSETQEKYPARWNNTEDQILSNTHREKIGKKTATGGLLGQDIASLILWVAAQRR